MDSKPDRLPEKRVSRFADNEQSFENLVNSVGGIVWEAGASDFQFTYVSPGAERILGYSPERWTTEHDFWVRHLHPEDLEWAVPYCIHATRRLENHEFEYRMIAADGRIVWLRDIVTVHSKNGAPSRICGVMFDITESKAIEVRQRELEERLMVQNSALVELAKSDDLSQAAFDVNLQRLCRVDSRTLQVQRVGIWFFDQNRSVLRCANLYTLDNDRNAPGIEISASGFPRYFSALTQGRTVAADDARQHPATSEFKESYLIPLGITSMLDAPIRRGGQLVGVVCHEHIGPRRTWSSDERKFAASIADFVTVALEARDRQIAEREVEASRAAISEMQLREKSRIEDELRKAKKDLVRQTRLVAIGQVAASIAHELRNPLGVIRNSQYYLQRRLPDNSPEWSEYLDIIGQEIHNADRIIGNLLEMSRPKQPAREKVDLGPIVQQAFQRIEGSERLRLKLELDPEPFLLFVDPAQLRQVLNNLLTNSIQASTPAGSILVKARNEGTRSIVTVHDEGSGIPDEDRERIFEPLFTRKAKGTGLGLAICRQIAEGHGGTLHDIPTAGRGAVMRLEFPMMVD